MNLKNWQNMFHAIINANLIVQHDIQIKNETKKHVNVNVKVIVSRKKSIVGILVHVFMRIVFKKYTDKSLI